MNEKQAKKTWASGEAVYEIGLGRCSEVRR